MLNKKTLMELEEYIHLHQISVSAIESPILFSNYSLMDQEHEIEDFINTKRKPSLQQLLFTFIDQSGVSDPDVYKKAGLDRKLFSKIRSNPDYHPSKPTIISLALALELTEKETEELLNTGGYSLSESDTFDLVIQFCIERKIYNIHDVNMALEHYNLKPLN